MDNIYENGSQVSEKYFDVDGSPMLVNGCHEIRADYDELGNEIETRLYTADHQLVSPK